MVCMKAKCFAMIEVFDEVIVSSRLILICVQCHRIKGKNSKPSPSFLVWHTLHVWLNNQVTSLMTHRTKPTKGDSWPNSCCADSWFCLGLRSKNSANNAVQCIV